jgi:hypothetical protein
MTDSESTNGSLTVEEAFQVMSEYVWQFHEAFGGDIVQLLSDTGIGEVWGDLEPTDPAAMSDWAKCVAWVRSGGEPRSRNILTSRA